MREGGRKKEEGKGVKEGGSQGGKEGRKERRKKRRNEGRKEGVKKGVSVGKKGGREETRCKSSVAFLSKHIKVSKFQSILDSYLLNRINTPSNY